MLEELSLAARSFGLNEVVNLERVKRYVSGPGWALIKFVASLLVRCGTWRRNRVPRHAYEFLRIVLGLSFFPLSLEVVGDISFYAYYVYMLFSSCSSALESSTCLSKIRGLNIHSLKLEILNLINSWMEFTRSQNMSARRCLIFYAKWIAAAALSRFAVRRLSFVCSFRFNLNSRGELYELWMEDWDWARDEKF